MSQQIQIADIFLNDEFWRQEWFDQDSAPASWNLAEEGAADMDEDSVKWIRSLANNDKRLFVNMTHREDDFFSVWSVDKVYEDVFILALDIFNYQWDYCQNIDSNDYENYIQSEYEEEE